MVKRACTGLLSPAGGGVGGGILLRGGRSLLLLLMCMVLLLVSGFLGNSSASAAVDYPPLAGVQGVDSFTKLLIHGDSIADVTGKTVTANGDAAVSNAGKTVTASGNAQIDTAQSKFSGASGLFDGSGDYLSIPDSDDWNFGSGDFTIDFWVRFNSVTVPADDGIGLINHYGSGGSRAWSVRVIESGGLLYLYFSCYPNDATPTHFSALWNPVINTWYHVAVSRNGNTLYMFLNGALVATNTITVTIQNVNQVLTIGSDSGIASLLNGYLDELHISKGIARWTSNFAVPTQSHTSDNYTKLLLHFDGSDGSTSFTDASRDHFKGKAISFDGTGDYLSLADSDDWNFGSGAFTVDFWVKFRNSASNFMMGQMVGDSRWHLYVHPSSGGIAIYSMLNGSTNQDVNWAVYGTTRNLNQWYHFAFVRIDNGNTAASWRAFQDGVSQTLTLNTGAWNGTMMNSDQNLLIGSFGGISDFFDGCSDEIRISKGIARWTSNFTPPSAPYGEEAIKSPAVTTSAATNVTATSATLTGTVNANGQSTTAWFNYGTTSGSYTGISTTQSVSGSSDTSVSIDVSGLSSSTTYYYRIAAQNTAGASYGSETSFTTSTSDTTAPSGSITINSGASYTNFTAVTLTLSATDNVGVTGYYLSDSSTIPSASASGWTSITSTTSYSGTVSYSLSSGEGSKTIYAWYKDAVGNVSSTANATITYDTTAPTVTISSPTSSSTYTSTSGTISLSGSASDISSGISSVIWSNSKGGNGTATGTASWTVSSVNLSSGDNVITVTAKDNAGNTSTDTITVTYSAAIAPTVTTGSASNVTATSATLTGTVNANGLSTTAWFEYGTVKGTYGSKSSTKTVTGSNDTTVSITITGLTAETTYYYRTAAQNNSGTSYGSEMTFIYSAQCSMPTVMTESATDVTSTTATLNGTVNANSFSTTAWFEYGKQSGVYGSKSDTKSVSGSTDTEVSISVKNLTSGTTYYFRIVAQNCGGTEYGEEMSFYYTSQTEAPTVATESATDVTNTSATLNGKCNPNGLSTTAWFEYGTLGGTYEYKTSTQSMSGSSITKVSATITGLTAGTTYYYRIVAKNSVGTSYGTEMEFYKSPGTDATPTPTITVTPTLPPSPTATPVGGSGSISGDVKDGDGNALQGVTVTIVGANGRSPSENSTETDENGYYEFSGLAKGNYTLTYEKDGYQTLAKNVNLGEGEAKSLGSVTLEEEGALGGIYGNVVDIKGDPIESVQIKLKGVKTKVTRTESSDADGYYEFTGLGADTYILTAKKKRYRKFKQTVTLSDGEEKEVEVEMRKTSKKIKGLFMMDDGQ